MTDNLVYIANSGAADYGITVAALDYDSGSLEVVQYVTEISECHYLNLHPNGKLLLATTMDGAIEVVVFALDAEGMLRKVSSAAAAGTSPAYVCADASGQNALLVNYVNGGARGNIRVYPLRRRWDAWARAASILRLTTAPDRTRSGRMCRIRT